MTTALRTARGVVRGRVQGVAFRASMAAEARRSGLAGWVRNLRDGRVEFAVGGPDAEVDALLDWARHGPPLARVEALEVEAATTEAELPRPFEVRSDA